MYLPMLFSPERKWSYVAQRESGPTYLYLYFILHCIDMALQTNRQTPSKEITTQTHGAFYIIKALLSWKILF